MTTIADVLKRKGSRVISVRAAETVISVAKVLAEKRIGAVVVEDSWMRPVGMFSERELVRAIALQGTSALHLSVSGFMSVPIKTGMAGERSPSAVTPWRCHSGWTRFQ